MGVTVVPRKMGGLELSVHCLAHGECYTSMTSCCHHYSNSENTGYGFTIDSTAVFLRLGTTDIWSLLFLSVEVALCIVLGCTLSPYMRAATPALDVTTKNTSRDGENVPW